MTLNVDESLVRTLRPGDNGFTFYDGIRQYQRAGFEISNNCPAEYKSIFITAIKAGWIKPVAYVHERELMIMGLSNGQLR
jgi:hypothetical protein